jgi:hypothetical protein
MTQSQAQQQYVVIFHIEAGNLRGFVEKVDAKKVDAEKAKSE